jgi:hypothetical protein
VHRLSSLLPIITNPTQPREESNSHNLTKAAEERKTNKQVSTSQSDSMEEAARHPAPERCLFGDGFGLLPKWANRYSVQDPKTKPFQLREWSKPLAPGSSAVLRSMFQQWPGDRLEQPSVEFHTLAPTPTKDA